MNIVIMTNTYTPIVGGIEKSIMTFAKFFRNNGHYVKIIAPEFKNRPTDETDVIRVPSIQNFNGTDFSVNLPIPGLLSKELKKFNPDIIHSQHPFLMGDMALRIANTHEIPIVFTYHTMFEQYLHYLPLHNEQVKRFVIRLSCGYANLTDQVIVPSESVKKVLFERNVTKPIEVIPTGVDIDNFSRGNRDRYRSEFNIADNAFTIGHLGRLEPEKNLEFLYQCVAEFMKKNQNSHFIVVGKGSLKNKIESYFQDKDLGQRLHCPGVLQDQDLVDVYHAMDVFAFSSHSETQGMVLVEAMASGTPVVAVDAPGVREIIKDRVNGRMIAEDNPEEYMNALQWCFEKDADGKSELIKMAHETALGFSDKKCAKKMVTVYEDLIKKKNRPIDSIEETPWKSVMNRMRTEWDMFKNITKASEAALELDKYGNGKNNHDKKYPKNEEPS